MIKFIEQGVSGAGLSIAADEAHSQSEQLDITGWRDLKAGDVIEITNVDDDDLDFLSKGKTYTVHKIDEDDENMPVRITWDDKGDTHWLEPGTRWKFISRPTC